MSTPESSPDRATLIASLRDYVEQIREEGLEGLEALSSVGPSTLTTKTQVKIPEARTTASRPSAASVPAQQVAKPPAAMAAVARQSTEPSPRSAPAELFYLYPELEKTTD